VQRCTEHEDQTHRRIQEESDEVSIVAAGDAVANPRAMVVKHLNTVTTVAAVMTPRWSVDVAGITEAHSNRLLPFADYLRYDPGHITRPFGLAGNDPRVSAVGTDQAIVNGSETKNPKSGSPPCARIQVVQEGRYNEPEVQHHRDKHHGDSTQRGLAQDL